MLLIDQEKPDQWSDIHIISLPKSGDLSKVGNYHMRYQDIINHIETD